VVWPNAGTVRWPPVVVGAGVVKVVVWTTGGGVVA
jgi:hypothetical protein